MRYFYCSGVEGDFNVDSSNDPSAGAQYQNNNDNLRQPSKKTRFKFKYIILFIQKFWYIVLVAGVVIAGFITWRVILANQNAAWDRASSYFAKADYKKAEEELAGLPVPSSAERLRVYAQTMLATQNLEKSLTAYEKLYKINKDPSVKLLIGNIYNQQKKYDLAIEAYREIITSNTGNVQAYVNLATVYKLQNKSDEAIKVSKEGVKNNPTSVILGELLVSMLMDDTNSAEFKSAVAALKKLNPSDPLLQSIDQ